MTLRYDELAIGDELPELVFGPVSRHMLALYCGGSGDHNPIHVDIDFAKNAGVGDVFAHGMLSMAVLGRLISEWVPQEQIREYGVRFTAITPVGVNVTCRGTIADKFEKDGENCVRLDLTTTIDDGTVTLAGTATVAL